MNKTLHDLKIEEMRALLDAVSLFEKAFDKPIFEVYVNPDNNEVQGDVNSITFTFNKYKGKNI